MRQWDYYDEVWTGNTLEEAMEAAGYDVKGQPENCKLLGDLATEVSYKPTMPEGTKFVVLVNAEGKIVGCTIPRITPGRISTSRTAPMPF